MDAFVEKEEVWATSVGEAPTALAATLYALKDAGVDLDFIIMRRAPEKPGTGVIFVTPILGDREVQAATEAGFSVTRKLHSVRVEGANEPGIAGKLAQAIGDHGIKVRGMSAAVSGPRFVAHFGLDSAEDQKAVIDLLSQL
jgi:hypothetical protein